MIPVPLSRRKSRDYTRFFLAGGILVALFVLMIVVVATEKDDTDTQEIDDQPFILAGR